MLERRQYERNDLMQSVGYCPSPHSPNILVRGLILDYSAAGLCLITHEPLEEGREIIVNSFIVPHSKTAIVKWYQDLGNKTYKVGLSFKRYPSPLYNYSNKDSFFLKEKFSN